MKSFVLLLVCLASLARAESLRLLGPQEALASGDVTSIASLAPGVNIKCLGQVQVWTEADATASEPNAKR